MSLHPDNRPKSVFDFRDALLGKIQTPTTSALDGTNFDAPHFSIYTAEQIAGYITLGLFIIGLITTLIR